MLVQLRNEKMDWQFRLQLYYLNKAISNENKEQIGEVCLRSFVKHEKVSWMVIEFESKAHCETM